MRRILFVFVFIFSLLNTVKSQINYGTTGLMNMPTADMQRDKTFMIGANWLNHHATVPRWWYDTWNYSINITIFPWLEVGYLCTGHKAVITDYGNRIGYWVPSTYGRFINQDRSFHFRLRVWKENWWKKWMPQVVIGANDCMGDSWNGGSLSRPSEAAYNNGFLNRYYLAVTKHFRFKGLGIMGTHLSWIYSNRFDNKLNSPAIGVNFKFNLPQTSFRNKIFDRLNLMAEVVPGYTDVKADLTFDFHSTKYQVNLGAEYSFWKDYINAVIELNRCRYFSGGLVFKVHLK
ncbi:YjbH domain-containing protein [Phocaeicola sp.]